MLLEFDISTSPTSQAIPPCDPDSQDDELDSVLSPIKLHQPTDCNCFNLPEIKIRLILLYYNMYNCK